MRLDDFAAAFRERVLPVLDLFQSSAQVARELPVSWLSMVTEDTIEWALACEDRDAVALQLRRHMERPLKGKQRWEDRIRHYRRGWEIAPGRESLPSPAVLVYSTLSLGSSAGDAQCILRDYYPRRVGVRRWDTPGVFGLPRHSPWPTMLSAWLYARPLRHGSIGRRSGAPAVCLSVPQLG
jgi:hypothetical protein